jgi:hypothetical protein
VLVGREVEVLEWRAVIVGDNPPLAFLRVNHMYNKKAERVLYSKSWVKAY